MVGDFADTIGGETIFVTPSHRNRTADGYNKTSFVAKPVTTFKSVRTSPSLSSHFWYFTLSRHTLSSPVKINAKH